MAAPFQSAFEAVKNFVGALMVFDWTFARNVQITHTYTVFNGGALAVSNSY